MPTAKEDSPGERSFNIRVAKERAREEGCRIYVLRWTDRGQSYTASMYSTLRSGPTECHGYCEKRGRLVVWVPQIVMDLDDAIAWLLACPDDKLQLAGRTIESARGDKEARQP